MDEKKLKLRETALSEHAKHKGKLGVVSKVELTSKEDLSIAYTPGVAEPCMEIYKNKADCYTYTGKGNSVAVVTNGTAVLGLGNIGPEAALPVMEGKAILFKQFGGIDAYPICLDADSPEDVIKAVKMISPGFGGINLEDISSPNCFEIEERLIEECDIPVFHDDQHGTAIVVVAALINALKVVGKKIEEVSVVLSGPGAAGTAIIKMLMAMGAGNIIAVDEYGILYEGRTEGMVSHKVMIAKNTNKENRKGDLQAALAGSDVFIGVSKGNILKPEMIQAMNADPIIFAMANPVPEIDYHSAKAAGARVVGTGRSDYPNQINNILAFPGIFKGALSVRAKKINTEMKKAAAFAIAEMVSEDALNEDYIVPSIFDHKVTEHVAEMVARAAIETQVV